MTKCEIIVTSEDWSPTLNFELLIFAVWYILWISPLLAFSSWTSYLLHGSSNLWMLPLCMYWCGCSENRCGKSTPFSLHDYIIHHSNTKPGIHPHEKKLLGIHTGRRWLHKANNNYSMQICLFSCSFFVSCLLHFYMNNVYFAKSNVKIKSLSMSAEALFHFLNSSWAHSAWL